MKIHSLHDLFVDQIKDLYSAEQQILKALPKLEKASTASDLKTAYQDHLVQTKTQVERLNQIFSELNIPERGQACKGMEGILEEGEELMKDSADPDVRDAGMIASAQRVEHYEISGYGTARTYAQSLGYTNAARLLSQTLQEERQTDEKLTSIAETHVNKQAKTGK